MDIANHFRNGAQLMKMMARRVNPRRDRSRLRDRISRLARAGLAGILVLSTTPAVALAEALTIDEAVAVALAAQDPTVARFNERAAALDDLAVADSQLPDPQLRVGLTNFPIDKFNCEQEPMTQVQVGLRQNFPRGRTLKSLRARREAEADSERAALQLQELRIVFDVRTAWLELYYWIGARRTVEESRAAVRELVEVIQSAFAAGLWSNQDLLRAELELSLLEDRAVDIERQVDRLRADLGRVIGADHADRDLPSAVPTLPMPPGSDVMVDQLTSHPSVDIEDSRIAARERDIDLARAQYRPGWSLDVSYGGRGGRRADFASVMVVLDVPLFVGKRQDRRLSAAQRGKEAARHDRGARLLELKQRLDRAYADWARLAERIRLYEQVVVQRSASNAEAALDGYQNQVTDFAELIRSRLGELNTELQLRRLRVDHALAQSELLFLSGEIP